MTDRTPYGPLEEPIDYSKANPFPRASSNSVQAQDSLLDQLDRVWALAIQHGEYDAADQIKHLSIAAREREQADAIPNRAAKWRRIKPGHYRHTPTGYEARQVIPAGEWYLLDGAGQTVFAGRRLYTVKAWVRECAP